tara:strand:+ start:127285 stop:127434 length:150 start_codon:yes stop_codon:yes gene_type:complete
MGKLLHMAFSTKNSRRLQCDDNSPDWPHHKSLAVDGKSALFWQVVKTLI